MKFMNVLKTLIILGISVIFGLFISLYEFKICEVRFWLLIVIHALIVFKVCQTEMPDKLMLSEEDRRICAIHEAGHMITALLLGINVVKCDIKCNIILGQGGCTICEGLHTGFINTSEIYLRKIKLFYAGRIAEKILLGITSTGAESDFQQATDLAFKMICKYGMGENLLVKSSKDKHFNNLIMERNVEVIEKICRECYDETYTLIETNKNLVQDLANILFEKRKMNRKEIESFKKIHNI